jgi:hypothetical protein
MQQGFGMAARRIIAGANLPHAAAGDIGAVHHDTSLNAPAISWTELLFFCEALLEVAILIRNPTSGNGCYCTPVVE